MISGLRGNTHNASFTLAPNEKPKTRGSRSAQQPFTSVFTDGCHFRLQGLEVFLNGILPRPEAVQEGGSVRVDIQILTSGAYADVQDDKVMYFTSLPQSKIFSYELAEDGSRGRTVISAAYTTQDYNEPTPFTQWTITLLHPERFDLSGMTGVDLEWTGRARFVGSGVEE
jgi:hypothetical protein